VLCASCVVHCCGCRWRACWPLHGSAVDVPLPSQLFPSAGQFPHVEVNPFEPEVDWFTRDVEVSRGRGQGNSCCSWAAVAGITAAREELRVPAVTGFSV